MWLMFNDGFISAVQHFDRPNTLVVRARRRDILDLLFPAEEVAVSDTSDYRYRVQIDKEHLAVIMLMRVFNIDYSNFKMSTKDSDLHALYSKIWTLHQQYQK